LDFPCYVLVYDFMLKNNYVDFNYYYEPR